MKEPVACVGVWIRGVDAAVVVMGNDDDGSTLVEIDTLDVVKPSFTLGFATLALLGLIDKANNEGVTPPHFASLREALDAAVHENERFIVAEIESEGDFWAKLGL